MDPDLLEALLYAGGAGGAILLGAALAAAEGLAPQWIERELRHSVTAFGGGVLVAAVAFVLAPKGAESLGPVAASAAVLAGGAVFLWIDKRLQESGAKLAQLLAMLLDFLPEAAALGALLATGDPVGLLLALIIGLQNLPEAFNAYRELRAARFAGGRWTVFGLLALCALLGPAAAALGFLALGHSPDSLAVVMLTAAGGILYLTFQDIAPEARLEAAWGPPFGAVAGFTLGLAAHMALG
ncbi:MAG: hypothetical protein RIB45_11590 [Marivibrio sp.]|uniref:hypothetical protein n=1 Tax=Marivibrio sp. TaxID=2039719 RepID=UPI0032EB3994